MGGGAGNCARSSRIASPAFMSIPFPLLSSLKLSLSRNQSAFTVRPLQLRFSPFSRTRYIVLYVLQYLFPWLVPLRKTTARKRCYGTGCFGLDDTIIISFCYVKLFLQARVVLFLRSMSKGLIQNVIDHQGLQISKVLTYYGLRD